MTAGSSPASRPVIGLAGLKEGASIYDLSPDPGAIRAAHRITNEITSKSEINKFNNFSILKAIEKWKRVDFSAGMSGRMQMSFP
jgi:hypothetical protein